MKVASFATIQYLTNVLLLLPKMAKLPKWVKYSNTKHLSIIQYIIVIYGK